MPQIKNNNSKKNSLESIIEKERIQMSKTIEKLKARIFKLTSDKKKTTDCLTSIRNKLSGEDILISKLIIEIGKTLQEVNNGDKI